MRRRQSSGNQPSLPARTEPLRQLHTRWATPRPARLAYALRPKRKGARHEATLPFFPLTVSDVPLYGQPFRVPRQGRLSSGEVERLPEHNWSPCIPAHLRPVSSSIRRCWKGSTGTSRQPPHRVSRDQTVHDDAIPCRLRGHPSPDLDLPTPCTHPGTQALMIPDPFPPSCPSNSKYCLNCPIPIFRFVPMARIPQMASRSSKIGCPDAQVIDALRERTC